jgi:two-component system cell cycle response regulator
MENPKTILVVDDNPAVLKLLADILLAGGYKVRSAISGDLALHSVAINPPDMVLLDIRMPGMDGFEVCKQLKADERLKDIPVIFISAASDTEDKVRAFQEGGIDYITKPFQKEEVLARVETHVSLSRYIQEIKKTTEALHKSEETLRQAQSIARLGYWEWDIQSGQINCSEEACRILGLKPPMDTSRHEALLQTVHPDDRARVEHYLKGVQSGHGSDIEYRVMSNGGQLRVLHARTIQDVDESHQIKMRGIIQDITEQKELQGRLEKLANTDALTGCASRRFFLERAEDEWLRVRRYGGELSMLMLDLDHFKKVNDRYGHEVGDVVLKNFVQICQAQLRDVDLLGRLGGEEFAIMLPQTASAQALSIAERVCQSVAVAEVPVQNGSPPIHFTTSIGIASLSASDAGIGALLNRADAALYKAKDAGRNQAVLII